MATRQCDSCGKDYAAKRANSRFCSDRCRKRAQRGDVIDLPAREPSGEGALAAAARAELEAAGVLESFLGQDALRLVSLVEGSKGTDAAMATLNREMRVTMAEALARSKRPDSPVTKMRDELAARREARGA